MCVDNNVGDRDDCIYGGDVGLKAFIKSEIKVTNVLIKSVPFAFAGGLTLRYYMGLDRSDEEKPLIDNLCPNIRPNLPPFPLT